MKELAEIYQKSGKLNMAKKCLQEAITLSTNARKIFVGNLVAQRQCENMLKHLMKRK